MGARVVIVDHGAGNIHSVKKALDRLGANCVASSCPKEIASADKLVLPGIGHFGAAMAGLKRLELIDSLNEAVLQRGTPVLGICLGMELMAAHSEEGDVRGLGWLDAVSVRFSHADNGRYKVPHMGWNQVLAKKNSRIMTGVDQQSEFYFAHSYYLKLGDDAPLSGETEYKTRFPSVVERENIMGVQFHPEKSHDSGRRVLENFVRM